MEENEYWNLYAAEGDMLDAEGRSPRFGRLTIFTETKPCLPMPLRKCLVQFEDRQARAHWGKQREFWVRDAATRAERRETALAQLNGKI